MTPEPPSLPPEMVGPYTSFLKSLHAAHGLTISPARYLRLCLEAASAPVLHLQLNCRARVRLLIGTTLVDCVYAPQTRVLVVALSPHRPHSAPQPDRTRIKVCENGGRRKLKDRRKKWVKGEQR